MEEILEFCFKKFAAVWLFRNFLFSVLPVILLIPSKGTAGLSAVWIPVFFFTILAAAGISFRVSSTFGLSRRVSDKSETMSGLSSGANARSLINIIKSRGLKLGDFCF